MITFALAFFICAWLALVVTIFYVGYRNMIASKKPEDTFAASKKFADNLAASKEPADAVTNTALLNFN
jgi:hypothetical protein